MMLGACFGPGTFIFLSYCKWDHDNRNFLFGVGGEGAEVSRKGDRGHWDVSH